MKSTLTLLFSLVTLCIFAHSPIITYSGPQVYTVGKAITPLKPINTGGAVSVYGTVMTLGTVGGQAQSLTFNADRNILFAPLGNTFKINQVIMPYEISLLAGSGVKGSVDGVGAAAQFSNALGSARHPLTEEIYVSDADRTVNVIKKINPATGEVTHYAGLLGKQGTINGSKEEAQFDTPRGIAFDENGNLYVAQFGLGAIRKISADGTTISSLVDNNQGVINFSNPWGLAYYNGYLYVTDEDKGQKISKVNVLTGEVTLVAGENGTPGYADGNGANAKFRNPRGIAVDEVTGDIYVADYGNDRIRKITPDGEVTTVSGYGVNETKDGIGTAAGHRRPAGIALDGLGHLYVCDAAAANIRKVSIKVNPNSTPYSVSPSLPEGLILNTQTGVISGTPVAASVTTDYTITAINGSGTSEYVLNLTVQVPSAVQNASKDQFKVTVAENREVYITGLVNMNSDVTIYDVHGKQVLSAQLIPGNSNTISCSGLKSGLYILSVNHDNQLQHVKLVL